MLHLRCLMSIFLAIISLWMLIQSFFFYYRSTFLILKCIIGDHRYPLFILNAGMYTIEFQKRGLLHAHILLWLHPAQRCVPPSDVDRIISAELPDKIKDPATHRAVLEFMIHGPCGTVKPGATCMRKMMC